EGLTQAVLALGLQIQDPDAVMIYGLQTFALRREQGRLRELEEPLQGFVAQYPTMPAMRCWLALLHSELGREAEARGEYELVAGNDFADLPRDVTWLPSLAFVSEVCSFLGDAPRARGLYALLRPHAARTIVAGNAVVSPGGVSHYL